jgi:hypothetical protein
MSPLRWTTHQDSADPVISVDTKKKELVGEFANAGRQWRPAGEPVATRTHDFPDAELGKAVPYGVYDLTADTGWVNVGIDHDTAAFAVESIRRWWTTVGQNEYPTARRLLITADAGAPTATAPARGRPSWPRWPCRPAWRSPSVTSRPAPPNGTRSSTGCSRTSP